MDHAMTFHFHHLVSQTQTCTAVGTHRGSDLSIIITDRHVYEGRETGNTAPGLKLPRGRQNKFLISSIIIPYVNRSLLNKCISNCESEISQIF